MINLHERMLPTWQGSNPQPPINSRMRIQLNHLGPFWATCQEKERKKNRIDDKKPQILILPQVRETPARQNPRWQGQPSDIFSRRTHNLPLTYFHWAISQRKREKRIRLMRKSFKSWYCIKWGKTGLSKANGGSPNLQKVSAGHTTLPSTHFHWEIKYFLLEKKVPYLDFWAKCSLAIINPSK